MRNKILLTFALLCVIAQFSWAQTISIVAFKTYSWNEEKHQLVINDSMHEVTKLSATMYQLEDGWYSVDESFTYNNRVIIKGDVKLILRDNTTLTASRGIKVNSNATLTIYAQSDGEETGKLIARTTANDWAAIGGEKNDLAGSVIIHGGNIDAKANYKYGAGIGGGYGDGSGMKEITIYGGSITARAVDNGAAIGAAKHNNYVGTINIYGGFIDAIGGKYAAGIGGAEDRGGWKTNIYGGTVFATGGEDGAGIGGGYDGDGGNNLKFYGGNIYATGGYDGAAIGGGYKGDGGIIVITGGRIEATTSDLYIDRAATPIGAGNKGNAGSTYNGETVTNSWSGYIIKDTGTSSPGWRIPASTAQKVVFTENFRQVEPASLFSWFYGFKFLTTIEGIENLNTRAVANMNSTFHTCSSLETINLSSFNVSKVYEASGMFRNCTSLTTIYCNDTWNIGSSYDMFINCEKLKGAVPYDASKVTGAMANPETGYFTKTDATGISLTPAPTPMDEKHGYAYTLQGIRISPESMRKGHTYIYNGKKVVR